MLTTKKQLLADKNLLSIENQNLQRQINQLRELLEKKIPKEGQDSVILDRFELIQNQLRQMQLNNSHAKESDNIEISLTIMRDLKEFLN